MKVGILTFHRAKNYGAVLQAFALLTALKKMNIDAYIIDRYNGGKTIFYRIYYIFHPKLLIHRQKWKKFNKFGKEYLTPRTKKYDSDQKITLFQKENFDAVIAGSDQVWRMEYSEIGYNYFFDFIKDKHIKKISYAASFGKEKWTDNKEVTSDINELISKFEAVSVREISGVDICKNIFNTSASHVLDPTLLLDKSDYESLLLEKTPVKQENSIISYLLGGNNNQLKICAQFAKNNNLAYMDLYHISPFCSKENDYGKKNTVHLSVQEWLNQIRNARFIITNSFHAVIFAILFGRQFIVINHESGGTARISSLLKLLELENHFINNLSELSMDKLHQVIDYKNIYSIIDKERIPSLEFLTNALFKK